jgi:hypothetical protein
MSKIDELAQAETCGTGDDWPEPEEIKIELPPVEKISPELTPEPLRGWLVDIADRMQCPLDFVAAGVLVAGGALIGTGCGIRPKKHDDWLVIPNLWGGIVARPSMLKTPALTEVLKPFAALEATAKEEYDDRLRGHAADHEIFKAQKEAVRAAMLTAAKMKDKKPEADLDSLRQRFAEMEEPATPTRRRFKTNDATIEKLGELLNENPRGLLLFRDELTGMLASFDREGREQDRAFFLEAWNGYGSFTTDRIGRGTVDTQNLCVSILGGIQPAKLQGYLLQAASDYANDGLLQRFQMLVYPDEPKWQHVDRLPDVFARKRAYRVFENLANMDFMAAGATLADGDKIPHFRFSKGAQSIFNEWLTDLQTAKLQADDLPALIEHLAKYRSLMPALALIFHLIDTADGGTRSGAVSEGAALRGAALCEYLESHARRVYAMLGDISTRSAAELAKKITRGALQNGFTLRDIYRHGWHLLTTKELAQGACDELVAANWLRTETQGKTRAIYHINPKILPTNTQGAN